METIVVYESIYGNTRDIACAIANGLGGARVLSPQQAAAQSAGAEFLVVGGPTHAHGLTTKRSRAVAVNAAKAAVDASAAEQLGLRDWLQSLPRSTCARAAAFDTRLHGRRLFTGAASRGIARRLRRHGYDVLDTASFFVRDTQGPLDAREVDRARAWGENLAAKMRDEVSARAVGSAS